MSKLGSLLQVRSKIWLEIDSDPVFGKGRDELLRLIKNTGSISAAAKSMGIPYRKARTLICLASESTHAAGEPVKILLLDRSFELGESAL